MYAIEFQSNIKNGIINIPAQYKELYDKMNVKCLVMIDDVKRDSNITKKMGAISIDTKAYKFDRNEANER